MILALTDADVPTLLVMTHQAMDYINKRHLASVQLIAESNNRAKNAMGGQATATAATTTTVGHGVFGGSLRGMQGLGSAFAGLICEDNTVRTSYDSTLANLKTLKKKCIPRDHVVIPPVNPVDVKNRIAASLHMHPATVDVALNQALFSLCDGQSFWLGEMIVHMLEYGLEEFTAQLQVEGWLDNGRESGFGGRRVSRHLLRIGSAVGTLKRG